MRTLTIRSAGEFDDAVYFTSVRAPASLQSGPGSPAAKPIVPAAPLDDVMAWPSTRNVLARGSEDEVCAATAVD